MMLVPLQARDSGVKVHGDNMKKSFKSNLAIEGRVRPILKDAKTGKIKWIGEWNHNIIPTVGLRAIARRYANVASLSNEGAVTYGAVGTGATSPIAEDTVMENEIERKLITIKSEASRIAHLEVFFVEAEANDTITKFALFGEEASGLVDSGTLMEYADFASPFTKTSNETLTIEIDITVADA